VVKFNPSRSYLHHLSYLSRATAASPSSTVVTRHSSLTHSLSLSYSSSGSAVYCNTGLFSTFAPSEHSNLISVSVSDEMEKNGCCNIINLAISPVASTPASLRLSFSICGTEKRGKKKEPWISPSTSLFSSLSSRFSSIMHMVPVCFLTERRNRNSWIG
jgi:hypothetical protein